MDERKFSIIGLIGFAISGALFMIAGLRGRSFDNGCQSGLARLLRRQDDSPVAPSGNILTGTEPVLGSATPHRYPPPARLTMQTIFVMMKCEPGAAYDVAAEAIDTKGSGCRQRRSAERTPGAIFVGTVAGAHLRGVCA